MRLTSRNLHRALCVVVVVLWASAGSLSGAEPPKPQPKPQPKPAAKPAPEPAPEPPPRLEPAPIEPVTNLRSAADDFLALGIGLAAAPPMIGDLPGGGPQFTSYSGTTFPVAGGDAGATKIAENNSPLPRDRWYCTYQHFHNALYTATGMTHLDRYTLGIEKTFLDGTGSLEFRVPFADGLSAAQTVFTPVRDGVEFGNISLILKTLLWENQTTAVSAGLAATLPTGSDAVIIFPGGTTVFENQSLLLSPFLAVVGAPNERRFWQAYVQFAFDVSGNRVDDFGLLGRYYYQSLMMVDLQAGYWLFRRPDAWVRGIAPVIELHYTSTLQNTDFDGLANSILNLANRQDIVNLTAGLQIALGPRSLLSVAAGAPLRTGTDRVFDGELMVLFNRRY